MRKEGINRLPEKKSKMPILRQQNPVQAEKGVYKNQGAMTKYKALIAVKGDGPLIGKIFAAEDGSIKNKASYRLKNSRGGAEFSIEAEDSVGLRAALNSITKILTVIEKVKKT